MEEYLDSLGLFRKHVARDGSCLFRAVSEQVFHTQSRHHEVRKTCIHYLDRNRKMFEDFIDGPFDQYLENLNNPKEWAGHVEISAMSLIYRRDFLVYQEVGKPPCRTTNNGFSDFITLCYSHGNHYDIVYPKSFLESAAVCQSLVYEVLYKFVFKLGDEVDVAVKKMLHDKAYSKQRRNNILNRESHRESSCSITKEELGETNEEEKEDASAEIRKALAQGIPPFPYKVAKALDPEIYRNVEYDLWNELRKEQMRCEQMIIPDFAPGVKCLVRIEKDQAEPYHAHIQEMESNQGPVTVYVEELGEKCSVPYENLEALPIPAYKVLPWQGIGSKPYRMLGEYLRSSFQGKLKNKQKLFRKDNSKEIPVMLSYSPCTTTTQHLKLSTVPTFAFQGTSPTAYPLAPNNTTMGNYCISQEENSMQSGVSTNKFVDSTAAVVSGISTIQLTAPLSESPMTQFWNGTPPSYSTVQVPGTVKLVGQYPDSKNNCEQNEESTDSNNQVNYVPATFYLSDVSNSLQSEAVKCQSEPSEEIVTPVSPAAHPIHSSVSAVNQPITVYPCPVYSGMMIPYGESFSINLNPWRSQDPTGSDLPLADLPTVRFFYNLGCDYFRMTSMMHVSAPSAYSAWTPCNGSISYAVGTPCPSVSVPLSASECYDQRREDISQRNLNSSLNPQILTPQPVLVGNPPPSVSAHAIFYSSSFPPVSTPQTIISSPSYVASSLP